jgi:arabinan endo-1,5-alpha-L-arabinosidase
MHNLTLADIQIRDPFVLPVKEENAYYLFGTTDANAWDGQGQGFDCYRSQDLIHWEGPIPAFRPPVGFWATTNFWAPEAHAFQGKYYLFASFKAPRRYRGTQILVSPVPQGPYVPLSDGPITPPDWECLDGTFYVDRGGQPWIVFCHEWVQVHNGAVCAMPLSLDLSRPAGRPIFLFNASEAPWVRRPEWPDPAGRALFPTFVTDGPFLHRARSGALLMLWSSFGARGYAMGLAHSESGEIAGPWTQLEQPLWEEDGGHGMIFHDFAGQLYMTLHQPNQTPHERARLVKIEDRGGRLNISA